MLALYILCSCCWISGCMSLSQSAKFSRFISSISHGGYDKRIRPTQSATNVSVQIGLLAMAGLDLRQMSVGCEILLRMWWKDPRLAFDNTSDVVLSEDPSTIIWVPDVYVFNAIETKRHGAYKPNLRTVIGPNGNIYTSLRLSIEFSCEMDFTYFPMDTQICFINLESYSYKLSEVQLHWNRKRKPVDFIRDIHLLGYEISVYETKSGQLDYDPTQPFGLLQAGFRIKRIIWYYLFHIYIPSILVVILSWSSFWMPPSAVPARVTIIVTNFLTSMLVFHQSGSTMPTLSYHTALEVFALFNSILILMAMLEYLMVLLGSNTVNLDAKHSSSQHVATKRQMNEGFALEDKPSSPQLQCMEKLKGALQLGEKYYCHPNKLDRYSRVLFPFSYIVFVSTYFMYYLIKV